jgi:hypothetical protein
MGAIQDDNNVIFLNVSLGKIRRQLKEPTDETVTRVNKNQKEVHELVYDGWMGRLDDITNRKTDFGTEIQLAMNDGDQLAKIGFMYTSDHFLDFANRLLSFTPEEIATETIIIRPFSTTDTKDGKTYTNNFLLLKLSNEDGNRQRKYTKEEPGDMPQWEQVDNPNGEGKIWSQKKQRKFLAEKIGELMKEAQAIRDKMAPEPKSAPPAETHDAAEVSEPEDALSDDDEDGDPPF